MVIKEMNSSARPYEKFKCYGPQALSDEELLAVILKTGTRNESSVELAGKVIGFRGNADGLLNIMHMSYEELMRINGIGEVKAMQIVCIAQLSKRISSSVKALKPKMNTSEDIAKFYMEDFRHLERERMIAVFFDNAFHKVGDYEASLGTVNTSVAGSREILIAALEKRAVNIVLIHNHPSGVLIPSNEDKKFTENMIKACQICGFTLADHIIIGDRDYVSFASMGLIK